MLTFDPDKHIYYWNGIQTPSVTQIIESAGLTNFDFVPYDVLKKACELGTYVHRACQLHDLGTLDFNTLDPYLFPYLEAWKLFLKETKYKITINEGRLYSEKYKYAGTVDRVGMLDNEQALADIKTGIDSICHGIQLAAYENLLKENDLNLKRRVKRLTIKLFDSGKYKIINHLDRADFPVFLNALAIEKFKTKLR